MKGKHAHGDVDGQGLGKEKERKYDGGESASNL